MMFKHPELLLPFIFIAFFETLALELIYFCNRFPLSKVAAPIIKKFFGEAYLHYPAHLMIVPGLFYYAQVVIFIFAGTMLTAIAVNIFKNILEKLPIKENAMLRNAAKRYGALVVYGVILMALMAFLKPLDSFVFTKGFHLLQRLIPRIPAQMGDIGFAALLFLTNLLLQAIFIASIPYMILEKKGLFKAVLASVLLFIRNIGTIIVLIGLPFLVYLPVVAMKSISGRLAEATFPEIILAVTFLGSVISIFVDSFIVICVCRYITDRSKAQGRVS